MLSVMILNAAHHVRESIYMSVLKNCMQYCYRVIVFRRVSENILLHLLTRAVIIAAEINPQHIRKV